MTHPKIGFIGAVAFVVANMVGTGVFTSLGFQLVATENPTTILLLWFLGAAVVLVGATIYSELATVMPRSGGEYVYLGRIFHPALGFMSGFVSLIVGFAAPAALASMAFGTYAAHLIPGLSARVLAILVIVAITALHGSGVRLGVAFQTVSTALKIVLIGVFIACGLLLKSRQSALAFPVDESLIRDLGNPAFAVSLIYVNYAYSGWNAAAYFANEIDQPQRRLPAILGTATAIVAVLYLLLNVTFMVSTPLSALKGQLDVGYIAAQHIFGPKGGTIMAATIALLLVSSISSLVFIGPRVMQVMGEDAHILRWLKPRTSRGAPLNAIVLQGAVALLLVISSTFDVVLVYVGFTLNLFTFLAALGLFVHRARYPNIERPYRAWGYPLVPLLFLGIMAWTLVFLLRERPLESICGIVTALVGAALFRVNALYFKKETGLA